MTDEIKHRIKLVRTNAGLTQQKFAERLGLIRGTIANYESGGAKPIGSVVKLICKEFNINEEWLVNGNGEMHKQPSSDDGDLVEWVAKICTNKDEEFKLKFLKILKACSDQEWLFLEALVNKAKEILDEK